MTLKAQQLVGGGLAALACGLLVGFSGGTAAQGIYTCVDGKGRKLTSDRPIAECMDRDQRELNPSGSVRRVLTPPPAPKSRAELLADEKTEADARLQKAEENRRDRALRLGYPDRASHDKARTAALQKADAVAEAATKRAHELKDQRTALNTELDFYKNSPGSVPAAIKRRVDETDANIAEQNRLIADRDAEKKRINDRFDAEVVKLQTHWASAPASVAAAPGRSSNKKP